MSFIRSARLIAEQKFLLCNQVIASNCITIMLRLELTRRRIPNSQPAKYTLPVPNNTIASANLKIVGKVVVLKDKWMISSDLHPRAWLWVHFHCSFSKTVKKFSSCNLYSSVHVTNNFIIATQCHCRCTTLYKYFHCVHCLNVRHKIPI